MAKLYFCSLRVVRLEINLESSESTSSQLFDRGKLQFSCKDGCDFMAAGACRKQAAYQCSGCYHRRGDLGCVATRACVLIFRLC